MSKLARVLMLVAGTFCVNAATACLVGGETTGTAMADVSKTVQCGKNGSIARISLPGYTAKELIAGKAYGQIGYQSDFPGGTLAPLLIIAGEEVVYLQCIAEGPAVFSF